MKVTVNQQIRLALPEGTARTVLHVLLTPRPGPAQTVLDWQVAAPPEASVVSFADAFGNLAHLISQPRPPQDWVLTVSGSVQTQDRNGVLGRPPGEPHPRLFLRRTDRTRIDPALAEPLRAQAASGDRVALFHALMAKTPAVFREVVRAKADSSDKDGAQRQSQGVGAEAQVQTATLTAPATTARPAAPDLAHTFIALARALGFPARYVTGYLGKPTATAPAMHAWAEVFDEGLGWIGFDPLLQLCPTNMHVRVACGLDAYSAAPVRSVPLTQGPPTARLALELQPG